MDLDTGDKKTKFSYFGEILPNNDRSNAIIAQRREEEQRKKEEAERVRILSFLSSRYLNGVLIATVSIDQITARAGRKGTQEEGA